MSFIFCLDDDDDNESTSTRDDEEGDSVSNVLLYCGELISAVLEMKDSHGRVICQLFKKIPPQSVSSKQCCALNRIDNCISGPYKSI